MKKITLFFLFINLTILTISAQQKFGYLKNFVTESGDTIKECKIGYRTFGKLDPDSGNVIIFPTWFGGQSAHLKGLIAPDKLVDSSKFFVIGIDALSNGVSTSPSNIGDGNIFPVITISDMVRSQYKLLTEYLGFKKIYGAISGSMGGMQVFEWVTLYPNFIEKAIPYVGTPRPTSNDLLQWNIRLEIIDSYKKLNASEGQIQKLLNMQSTLLARTPDYISENTDENNFEKFLQGLYTGPNMVFTVDNYRAQLMAMLTHNIYKHFGNSQTETINSIKSEMFLIVSRTDHMVHPKNSITFAEEMGCGIEVLDNNCGHLAIGCKLDYSGKLTREFFKK